METRKNKIMKFLQKMPENKLTQSVLIPLLESLGFTNVEFFGGQNEEGKDIIFWENSKIGRLKLIVAQVKHFKLTNRASDSRSLQTIINQLIMCFEKKIIFSDQKSYLPDEVYLISSYPITIKTLQSRFSENSDLRNKRIEIIDGYKLVNLLFDHDQPILKQILGQEYDFVTFFESSLNNKVLLKALGYFESISLKEIYTDIDFSLGKKTTKLFFNTKFKGIKKNFSLYEKEWKELKNLINNANTQFGLGYINKSFAEIEDIYNKKKIESDKTISTITELEEQTKKYRELVVKIEDIRQSIPHFLNEIDQKLEKRETFSYAEISGINELAIKQLNNDEINNIIKNIKNEIKKNEEKINNYKKSVPLLTFDLEIDGELLAAKLNENKKFIEDKVLLFNEKSPNLNELKEFVDICNKIIESSSEMLQNVLISKDVLSLDERLVYHDNFDLTRLKLPITKIFNTGKNIIVLGEAGAGKTTCLQMYAKNKKTDDNKLIVWAPLSYVMQNWSKNKSKRNDLFEKDDRSFVTQLDLAIFDYLISQHIIFTTEEFEKIFQLKESVLLLDGLDEAIKHNSWLPEAIVKLSRKYIKSQIIVTSRMSGNYFDQIHFFTVTLLPFTSKQRDEFIRKWFGENNTKIINEIYDHLSKNESINNIINNPLLTTTLCVLANHGLPLPQSEIRLYNDRLKLLTGYYDNVKNIEMRITTPPQNLEFLAQKLAFFLHDNGVREMELEKLEKIAINKMNDILGENASINALNELIDPCNILVPMTNDGKYGFGHLRYQEHLAALEMKSNRSINIEKYINRKWWLDTLILFAQMSENIEWLINNMSFNLGKSELEESIRKLINVRPHEEQVRLIDIIIKSKKKLKKMASIENVIFDDYD